MSDRPTLDQVKALAAALPPSERVGTSEAADVLSGLTAILTRGKEILDAAAQGGTAVYDFLHEQAVQHAADNGHPEPERGAVTQDATTSAPAAASGAIDYDKLAAAIVRAQTQSENTPPSGDAVTVDPAAPPEHAVTTADAAGRESQEGTGSSEVTP